MRQNVALCGNGLNDHISKGIENIVGKAKNCDCYKDFFFPFFDRVFNPFQEHFQSFNLSLFSVSVSNGLDQNDRICRSQNLMLHTCWFLSLIS